MKHFKIQKKTHSFWSLLSLPWADKMLQKIANTPEVDLPGTSFQSKHLGTRSDWTGSAEY